MMAEIMVGLLPTTKDGTVTVHVPSENLNIHMTWREAMAASVAIARMAVEAAQEAGVDAEEYLTAMIEISMGEQP